MTIQSKAYKLADLITGLDATLRGDPNCLIDGVCTLNEGRPGGITFLINPLYRKALMDTAASAVILSEKDADACPTNAIITRNPHYVYSQIAAYFAFKPHLPSSIHPTAVLGQNINIHPSAHIGAHCVIGDHVTIAEGVIIGSNTTIAEGVTIGEGCVIQASVTLCHHVQLGKRVHLASGVVIGSDGFGFANAQGKWHKIEQLGSVIIGDDVDIGANTTIDRGAVGDTIIGDGVKLDNLVQVAHNVQIGANTIIAACVGISGSTTIGKNCMIGGATCFAGHVTVCDHVILTGMTSVTKSIREPGMYSSGILGAVPNQAFLKNNARFNRLEHLMERVKQLETTLKDLIESTAQ